MSDSLLSFSDARSNPVHYLFHYSERFFRFFLRQESHCIQGICAVDVKDGFPWPEHMRGIGLEEHFFQDRFGLPCKNDGTAGSNHAPDIGKVLSVLNGHLTHRPRDNLDLAAM